MSIHPVEKDLRLILKDPYFELDPSLYPFFKKDKHFDLQKLLSILEDTNNSNDSRARELAAELLGELGDPKAIPVLLKGVQDPDSELSWFSGLALVKFADLAVPGLLDILRNVDEEWRGGGASGFLAKIAENASTKTLYLLMPGLVELLHQSSIHKRNAAAQSIVQIHHPLAIWALVLVVIDTTLYDSRAYEAIETLASIGADTALIMLLNPMYDHKHHPRIITRLTELNTPTAIKAVDRWYRR